MNSIFIITLSTHVIAGVIGLCASYALLMALFKKIPSLRMLRATSLIAFLSYFLSWLAGGYYYVFYYGAKVKPVIQGGNYPWVHAVFMESKEHLFLFLPILTLTLTLILFLLGNDALTNRRIRHGVIAVASLVAVIALFVTLSGILISGSTS